MGRPRSGLALVGYDEYLCAIGGMGPHMQSGSVEVLNTSHGNWFASVPMNHSRMYHGAAVVGDRIIVLGGCNTHGNVGEVEWTGLITGVTEEQVPEIGHTGFATVARGKLGLDPGGETGEWQVFDGIGRIIAKGRGTAEIRLGSGAYFVRTQNIKGSNLTRVTITR